MFSNSNSNIVSNKKLRLNFTNDNLLKNINKLFISGKNNMNITIVKTINDNQKKILKYIDELNIIINNQKDIIKLIDYENEKIIIDNNIVKSNIDILMNRYGLNYKKGFKN